MPKSPHIIMDNIVYTVVFIHSNYIYFLSLLYWIMELWCFFFSIAVVFNISQDTKFAIPCKKNINIAGHLP